MGQTDTLWHTTGSILNETSYHGAGAIKEIVNEAKGRGYKKAFVCSDPDLVKFGVTGKVTKLLDEAGLAYELYSDIKPNPTIENVQTGVAAFNGSCSVIRCFVKYKSVCHF